MKGEIYTRPVIRIPYPARRWGTCCSWFVVNNLARQRHLLADSMAHNVPASAEIAPVCAGRGKQVQAIDRC
jgi:hypothetical protein